MQHPAWEHNTLALVSFVGTIQGQQIVNNLHFEASGNAQTAIVASGDQGAAWLTSLLSDLHDNLWALYRGVIPSEYVPTALRGQVLQLNGTSHLQLSPQERNDPPAASQSNPAPAALATAKVLQMRTPQGGKHHRGRIYLVASSDEVADGVLTNGGGSLYLNGRNAFLNGLASRYTGNTVTTAALGFLTVYSKPLHAGEQQWTVRANHQLQIKSNPAAYAGNSTGVTLLRYDPRARQIRRREIGVGS